ncbi:MULTISPECIES: hypothetical protein [unclassified Bradyrhizobium]|uniref:hypothetical protein n=1 Tax=unclassified Bradyrhizobium TaxID=2631580 RepID=UPI0028EB49E6|nr:MULTISPECIES: hypothetical protein [unclassified Bradyrhizobium]
MKEYAFDVKLWAVCRVKAEDEKQAREAMKIALDCVDVGFKFGPDIDGCEVSLTEASIEDEGDSSELIEIDGEAV